MIKKILLPVFLGILFTFPGFVHALNPPITSCDFNGMTDAKLEYSVSPSSAEFNQNFTVTAGITVPQSYRSVCSSAPATYYFTIGSHNVPVPAQKITSSGEFAGYRASYTTSYAAEIGSNSLGSNTQVPIKVEIAGRDSRFSFPNGSVLVFASTNNSGPPADTGAGDGTDNGNPPADTGVDPSDTPPSNNNPPSNNPPSSGTSGGGGIQNPIRYNNLIDLFFAVLRYMLLAIGALTVAMLIYGGFQMVLSRGNESALTQAKSTMTYAIIGLIIAIMSFSIVAIVQNVIGVK